MPPNYLILDLETSVNNVGDNAVGKFAASPFCKKNKVVSYGYCSRDDPEIKTTYLSEPDWNLSKIDVIVCHNLQFDFAYLLVHRKEEVTKWLQNGGKIHCTMVAEYLLTNLLHKFPSLDETCVKYNGVVKNDVIKDYWKAGIRTEDIPKHELIPYLETDVENTKKIYLGQLKKAKKLGMLNLFDCHFEAMLALIQMNLNGLRFDVRFARKEAFRLTKEILSLKESISSFMQPYFVPEFEVNPTSSQQISALLFSGPYKYRKRGPILNKDGTLQCKKERRQVKKLDEDGCPTYYKSGKRKGETILRWEHYDGEPKTKWYGYLGRCKGLGLTPNKKWQLKDKNYYSVGEDNLKSLLNKCKSEEVKEFLESIIKVSTLEKDLSTYFIGYTKLVWPDTGLIHPNFNTALTATGRLSASAPNTQNLSAKKGSKIKDCFVSRWGNNGRIVEADLAQIEVVVQAFLSQDKQMMEDIKKGIDFHCMRLAFKLKEDYQYVYDKCHIEEDPIHKKMRTAIKVLTFRKAYGAGAKSLGEAASISTAEAKEFIKNEAKLYPRIPLMQEQWAEEIEANKVISTQRTAKGEPAKTSYLQTLTGKRYGYVEEDIPRNMQMFSAYRDKARNNPDLSYQQFQNWGKPKRTGFKNTKIVNYYIQGLAGEVLCLILGDLSRKLLGNYKCLLVGTVHDSIILDVHIDSLEESCKMVLDVMESAPVLFEQCFNVKFNLPVRGEVEAGVTWKQKKLILKSS